MLKSQNIKESFWQEIYFLTLPLSFRVIFRHLKSLVIKYQFKVKDKVREKDVLAFCSLCNKNTLGDEYHNLMKFQVFSREVNDENCSKILPNKFESPINAIDSDLLTKKVVIFIISIWARFIQITLLHLTLHMFICK